MSDPLTGEARQSPASPTKVKRSPRAIRLGSGGALLAAKVATGRKRHRVIVLAGPPESGKTTIISTIFDEFHGGPFAGYYFAGSDSLVALEERCHEARVESELDLADTPRTSRAQVGDLINLEVGLSPTSRKSLMFNDVSGERFDAIIKHPRSAADMIVLTLAERIGVVLDGARLIDPGERDRTLYEAATLTRAILEHGVLKPEARLDVIVTKFDLVAQDGHLSGYVQRGIDRVVQIASAERRGELLMTAARSTKPTVIQAGTGLPELFTLWVGEAAAQRLTVDASSSLWAPS